MYSGKEEKPVRWKTIWELNGSFPYVFEFTHFPEDNFISMALWD